MGVHVVHGLKRMPKAEGFALLPLSNPELPLSFSLYLTGITKEVNTLLENQKDIWSPLYSHAIHGKINTHNCMCEVGE